MGIQNETRNIAAEEQAKKVTKYENFDETNCGEGEAQKETNIICESEIPTTKARRLNRRKWREEKKQKTKDKLCKENNLYEEENTKEEEGEKHMRVPCPIDGRHLIKEKYVKKHVKKCSRIRDWCYEISQPFVVLKCNKKCYDFCICKNSLPGKMNGGDTYASDRKNTINNVANGNFTTNNSTITIGSSNNISCSNSSNNSNSNNISSINNSSISNNISISNSNDISNNTSNNNGNSNSNNMNVNSNDVHINSNNNGSRMNGKSETINTDCYTSNTINDTSNSENTCNSKSNNVNNVANNNSNYSNNEQVNVCVLCNFVDTNENAADEKIDEILSKKIDEAYIYCCKYLNVDVGYFLSHTTHYSPHKKEKEETTQTQHLKNKEVKANGGDVLKPKIKETHTQEENEGEKLEAKDEGKKDKREQEKEEKKINEESNSDEKENQKLKMHFKTEEISRKNRKAINYLDHEDDRNAKKSEEKKKVRNTNEYEEKKTPQDGQLNECDVYECEYLDDCISLPHFPSMLNENSENNSSVKSCCVLTNKIKNAYVMNTAILDACGESIRQRRKTQLFFQQKQSAVEDPPCNEIHSFSPAQSPHDAKVLPSDSSQLSSSFSSALSTSSIPSPSSFPPSSSSCFSTSTCSPSTFAASANLLPGTESPCSSSVCFDSSSTLSFASSSSSSSSFSPSSSASSSPSSSASSSHSSLRWSVCCVDSSSSSCVDYQSNEGIGEGRKYFSASLSPLTCSSSHFTSVSSASSPSVCNGGMPFSDYYVCEMGEEEEENKMRTYPQWMSLLRLLNRHDIQNACILKSCIAHHFFDDFYQKRNEKRNKKNKQENYDENTSANFLDGWLLVEFGAGRAALTRWLLYAVKAMRLWERTVEKNDMESVRTLLNELKILRKNIIQGPLVDVTNGFFSSGKQNEENATDVECNDSNDYATPKYIEENANRQQQKICKKEEKEEEGTDEARFLVLDKEATRFDRCKKDKNLMTARDEGTVRLRLDICDFDLGGFLAFTNLYMKDAMYCPQIPPFICLLKELDARVVKNFDDKNEVWNFVRRAAKGGGPRIGIIEEILRRKFEGRPVRRLVCTAKHLCGNGTDVSIRCVVNGLSKLRNIREQKRSNNERGVSDEENVERTAAREASFLPHTFICIAPCCLHRCNIDTFSGVEFLVNKMNFELSDFGHLKRISRWLTVEDKRILGYKASVIMNMCRVMWLRSHGFLNARLERFVSPSMSFENLLIVASKVS